MRSQGVNCFDININIKGMIQLRDEEKLREVN